MDEIIKAIFSAPIATLLIIAGVAFLAISVLGKISNLFEAGKTGRFAAATIGTALLIIGLSISLKTTTSSSTMSSPSPVVTSSASQNSSISSTPPSSSGSSSCLQQFLQNIPRDRIATIESGARNIKIIRPDQPNDQPAALRLKNNGTLVSAIKFQFYPNNQLFKIQAVVDAQCHPVEDYRNATTDGDKHVLQNWNNLEIQLGSSTYTIRLGYDSDGIEASVNRSLPTL